MSAREMKPILITALLSNAQEMGRIHPDTFTAQPSLEQLDGLKEGDVVKICVNNPGERFWCIINSIKGETITAEVNNTLVGLPWPVGMKLRFHRDCIYQLWDDA
jgi:transcription antitermination factor NusG